MSTELPAPGVGVATDALIWVEGPDAISFLDGQVSQDVAGMMPGTVRRSFLLEPRGKLRALLWVLRDTDRVGLVTAADRADQVMADLDRFRFRVKATLRRDERPVHSVWGGNEGDPGRWRDDGTALTATLPAGPRVMVAAMSPPPGSALDASALDAHRVASGEPRFGVDVDDDTIPQETGLVLEAVSFTKGCYLGQELVARIDSRGHVNRTLRRVRGAGAAPPVGAEVIGDQSAGALSTVASAAEGWAALAMVRREVAPGGVVDVRWDGGQAVGTVEEIGLPADASHPSNTPSS